MPHIRGLKWLDLKEKEPILQTVEAISARDIEISQDGQLVFAVNHDIVVYTAIDMK